MMENGTLSAADMAAVMRGGSGNGWGGDGFGCGGWWVILFFLICMMGGWNNNGWGGNNGGAVPYAAAQAEVQRGFDQQATQGAIANLQTQVGTGFADAAVARCQGNAAITASINSAKDVVANGMNQLAMSMQAGFSGTQAGLADVKYAIATEACADRAAVKDGLQALTMQNNINTNEIIKAITQGTQSIKDDLCADRLAAKDAQIQALQNQLNMANLAASQTAQTAQLLTYGNQQAQNIVEQCCPKAKPAYIVSNPNGCGCGNGYYGTCGG